MKKIFRSVVLAGANMLVPTTIAFSYKEWGYEVLIIAYLIFFLTQLLFRKIENDK